MDDIEQLQQELRRVREDTALVIHALDCSVRLIEALIAYYPDNTPMHPDVSLSKAALDNAMKIIGYRVAAARKP